jgi:hypothetical protein
MSANASEKRKLPRFHITPCQFHDQDLKKNFSVKDVSMGGLAIRLVDREDLAFFPVASEHQGLLKIEGLKLPCRFQVRYLRGTMIGAEWINLDPLLKEHLEKISLPKVLGSNLKAYDFQDAPNTIWYHNPIGVDLLLYLNDSKINRWTLFVHQDFLSWDDGSVVKSGRSLAEDEEGYAHGIVRLETRLLNDDEQLNMRLVEVAIELVKSAPFKEESIRQLVLNHLQGAV